MVRKQIYVTDEQERFLKEQSNKKGMTEAELVRRALEEYMNPKDIKGFNYSDGT